MIGWGSLIVLLSAASLAVRWSGNRRRRQRFARGRVVTQAAKRSHTRGAVLRFGPLELPESAATGHVLVAGTTGSGKSLVQRLLMYDVVAGLREGSDARIFIFDAKGDSFAFLRQAHVAVPVYSLNPFDGRTDGPTHVAWDIAADITSCARAQNLAAILIPSEGHGGGNQYFIDAGRQVLTGVVESLIRNSPGKWTFGDLVHASRSIEHIRMILQRDRDGNTIFENFFGDERTGYQVSTMIASRMGYYRPIAALWQHVHQKLSIRQWLQTSSVLLLGSDATAAVAVGAINEVIFRIMVEEIDAQSNSSTRRTWVWIDEARLAGPLLRNEMLTLLAVKGRSRGAALVLSFQDVDGFREAAGVRLANEIVAQCSHKALLRMESDASAAWASRQIGQQESLELFRSRQLGHPLKDRTSSLSEQRVQRDAVLASEFFQIPVTSRENGLTGYFLSPHLGATRGTIRGTELLPAVVDETFEHCYAMVRAPDIRQWLEPWRESDYLRLGLQMEPGVIDEEPKKRLRLRKRTEPICADHQKSEPATDLKNRGL